MYDHIDVDEAARAVNMAIDRGIDVAFGSQVEWRRRFQVVRHIG